jgi:phosphoglycerol transferase MdoB-like AlkP superfamily enzyme
MAGAVAALDAERKGTFFGFVPWWAFYVAGGLLLAILPVLVWKQYKWLTRILCFGPAVKALVLFWRMGLGAGEGVDPFQAFFALVAVLAASMLALAGWGDSR